MARPKKDGIDYFSFDIDFFDDEKIMAISGEFGVKGEVVAIRLLCAIYRKGYFIEWSNMLQLKLAKQSNISHDLIAMVTARLVKYGFFDEALFNESGILTSRGIQSRWQSAVRKRVYKNSKKLPFWLLEKEENDVKKVSDGRNKVSDGRNLEETQLMPESIHKVKESKVKYIKEKEKKENIPLTVEDSFEKFDTAGVRGRYFSTISQIYNLNEKTVKEEFGKWKLKNNGENFNNEKHLRDSFNYWMRNYRPPRGSTEATMNTIPVNNRKNRNPS